MVNGQTGAVQAAVREDGRERTCGLAGASDGRTDGERTMRSAPVPIHYERPSHLYRVLSPEEAFGGKIRKMGGSAATETVRGGASAEQPAKKHSLFSRLRGK